MLAELLLEHCGALKPHLFLGKVDRDKLIDRFEKAEQGCSDSFNDEKVWTFLVACGYAMGGAEGVASLARKITGKDLAQPEHNKIWFEVLPKPPREREGNTNLDLALGAIRRRGNTKSGVKFAAHSVPWICFCEMKWGSDMSVGVTWDAGRNQLIRVIENALCFQANHQYARRGPRGSSHPRIH